MGDEQEEESRGEPGAQIRTVSSRVSAASTTKLGLPLKQGSIRVSWDAALLGCWLQSLRDPGFSPLEEPLTMTCGSPRSPWG